MFFRAQKINLEQQERLTTMLGELSGKPSSSKLHTHPLTKEYTEGGDFVTVISSEFNQIAHDADIDDKSLLASGGWHAEYSHIQFCAYSLASPLNRVLVIILC